METNYSMSDGAPFSYHYDKIGGNHLVFFGDQVRVLSASTLFATSLAFCVSEGELLRQFILHCKLEFELWKMRLIIKGFIEKFSRFIEKLLCRMPQASGVGRTAPRRSLILNHPFAGHKADYG